MPDRHKDWLRQAKRDLEHARHALKDEDYEWACFAAQQAAEKGVKALYQKDEAEKGIIYGEAIISFCEDSLL